VCAKIYEENGEREKNQFYEGLKFPSYNIKLMLGDMNAKVGKEIWTGIVVGTCDLHYESLIII